MSRRFMIEEQLYVLSIFLHSYDVFSRIWSNRKLLAIQEKSITHTIEEVFKITLLELE